MNWVDWVIVIVIAGTALTGLRRGFVLTLTRLVAQIVPLVAAFILTKPVAAFLETRFGWASSLAAFLGRYIKLPSDFSSTGVSNLSSGQLWSMLEKTGLPEQYKDAVVTWVAESPGGAQASLASFIQQSLGMLLLNVFVFIGLLLVGRWVITLFGKGVSEAVHTVGAGGLDRVGGLLLGTAQGGLYVAVFLGLCMPFLATWSPTGAEAINSSRLGSVFLGSFYMIIPWLRQIGQSVWARLQ